MRTNQLSLPYPLKKWQVMLCYFSKRFRMLFFFVALFFSTGLFAQIGVGTAPVNPPPGGFGIEGDLGANTPAAGIGDWLPGLSGSGGFVLDAAGNPLSGSTFHLKDKYTSPDDNFKGGFKVNGNPNSWLWVTNPVNDKEDMHNALIHFTHSVNGHLWVIIAADRKSNNGDAYIDFEFLQNTMTKTGGPTSGGFSSAGPHGGRTVNDFLLTLELTGGGSTATFFVNRWESVGGGNYNYVDKTILTPAGSVYAAVNNADGTPVSFGAFGKTTYDKNTFVEAAVDLTALLGAIDNCTELGIKTIFIKTKESQSPTATIVDFIAPLQGSITIGVADAGPDQTMCSVTGSAIFTVTGTATPSPGDGLVSTTWSVVPGTGTALINDPSALTTTVDVSSPSVKLAFNVKTTKGCDLNDTVELSLTSSPTIFTLTPVSFCNGDPSKGSCILNNSAPSVSYQLYNSSNVMVDVPQTGSGGQLSWTGLDPGTYYVVASAEGGCSSNTENATVNQNDVPTGSPFASNSSKCGPGDIFLHADCSASGIPTTPTWYDAATLGNLLATGSDFTPSVTGTQSFWVSCTSDNGCEGPRQEVVVTVNQPPATPTVDASNATQCYYDGIKVTASASTSDGSSVIWYDGSDNVVADPSLTTVGTVTYYAQAVTGSGVDLCTSVDRATAVLKINSTPGAPSVDVVDNCDGTSTLTVTTVEGATVTWSDDINNHDNPRIVNAAGTYKVTQTLGECTSGEGSNYANPKTKPGKPTVNVVDNCDGTSTLTASNYTGSLVWSPGGSTNESITVSSAGDFYVTQTVDGCTSDAAKGTAAPKTTPSAPSVSGTTTCAPTQATVTATGCTGTLKWYSDGTSTTPIATGVSSISTGTTQTYYVSCTNSSGCESSRNSATATVNICTGIYPTATDCNGFNSGTIQFLPKVCVTTKTSKGVTSVTNATPGVFFYYTKISAPATTFSVYIDQTQCSALNRNFAVQKGQVLAFSNACTKIASGAQASTTGDAVITIKNVHVGDLIVISVKYDVKSMVGATVTGALPLNCTDNFVARLGTTNAASIISNTSTSIPVNSNCSASAFTSSASIAKTDVNISKTLQVKIYPNPYATVINFNVVSPVSGKALVEIYDLMGKRLAIVYSGNIDAGMARSIQYHVPAGNRVPLMYKITVGDKSTKGMILPQK